MKAITVNMQAHLDGSVTTLCTCIRLIRRDGTVIGFTDLDADVTMGGTVYKAFSAIASKSALQTSSQFNVDNQEFVGALGFSEVSEADLRNGVYDNAELWVYMVNYATPDEGPILLGRGWLGNVQFGRYGFQCELRRLMQRFTTRPLEMYSPSCRADFCDARCGLSSAAYSYPAKIVSVTDGQHIVFGDAGGGLDPIFGTANVFVWGRADFTSGANAGAGMEITGYDSTTKTATLFLPMQYPIAVNDLVTVRRGCDKTLTTCRDTYGNVVNFRGEPYLPGRSVFQYGSREG